LSAFDAVLIGQGETIIINKYTLRSYESRIFA